MPWPLPSHHVQASLRCAFGRIKTFYEQRNWLLLVIDLVIIVAAVWVIVEAVSAMRTARDYPGDDDAELRELSVAQIAIGLDSPAPHEDTDAGHHHQRHRDDQPPTSG